MKNLITKSLLIVTILTFTFTWAYSAEIEYKPRLVITAGDIYTQCKDHLGIWNQSVQDGVAFYNDKKTWAVGEYVNMPELFERNTDGSVKKDDKGLPVYRLNEDNKPLVRNAFIENSSSFTCAELAEQMSMSLEFFKMVNPNLPCK